MPPHSRPRFDAGRIPELACEVAKYAKGPGFFKYGDSFASATVEPKLLVDQAEFVNHVHEKFGNISLTEKQGKTLFENVLALKQVAEDPLWLGALLEKKNQTDWVETMQNRFRAAVRHIVQAAIKKGQKPKWLAESFPDIITREEQRRNLDAEEPAVPGNDDAASPTWWYVWCNEQLKAYRSKPSGKCREWATEMVHPTDDDGNMSGKWADGTVHEFPDLTKAEYDAKISISQQLKKPQYFSEPHSVTSVHISMGVTKKDGVEVCVIYEGRGKLRKQLCQSDTSILSNSEEDRKKVLEVMTDIARKYCADKLKKEDLKAAKQEQLCEHPRCKARSKPKAQPKTPVEIKPKAQAKPKSNPILKTKSQPSSLPTEPQALPPKRRRLKSLLPGVETSILDDVLDESD